VKRLLFNICLASALCACSQETLRSGDLLFQAGESDFTDAVEAVTDGSFSHVGIVESTPDGIFVWEAIPEKGVARSSLQDFLDDAAHLPDGTPAVKACRVAGLSVEAGREAARKAESFTGRPYDSAFLPGMEEVYCSELVYECFRDAGGAPLFTANPMTFRDSTGQTLPYWTEYYRALGKEIPEGVPGTNPNDLSRDPILTPLDWKPQQ